MKKKSSTRRKAAKATKTAAVKPASGFTITVKGKLARGLAAKAGGGMRAAKSLALQHLEAIAE